MFVEWITALQIVVETGLIGRQANGAVTVTDGETVCKASIPFKVLGVLGLSLLFL